MANNMVDFAVGGSNFQVPEDAAGLLEAQRALNREMLALQLAAQANAQRFSTESNAHKAGHDAAMNSIRNIRS